MTNTDRPIQMDDMDDAIAEANKCLSAIPGLYQTIGKLQDRSTRMKRGSARWAKTEALIAQLQSEAHERSAFIRLVLHAYKPEAVAS